MSYVAEDTPTSLPAKQVDEMFILKFSVTANARITREQMYLNLAASNFPGLEEIIKPRSDTDSLRTGIAEALKDRKLSNFRREKTRGQQLEYKVVRCPAKTAAGEVREDFHLRERGKQVDYKPFGSIVYAPQDSTNRNSPMVLEWQERGGTDLIPAEVLRVLSDPAALLAFGRDNLFEKDLRRIADHLMEDYNKAWRGIWFVKTQEELSKARAVKSVLESNLASGKVALRLFKLGSDQETRENLISEMESQILEEYESLLDQMEEREDKMERFAQMFASAKRGALELQRALQTPFSEAFYEMEKTISDRILAWELSSS